MVNTPGRCYCCVSAGGNVFNVSVGWKKNRSDGLQQVCVWVRRWWLNNRMISNLWHISVLHNDNLFLLPQLVDILSMGFQNKFYNASKKDPGQASSPGVTEYRINVSSDTPHWYIRDYLARVSSHYDISAIGVDGKLPTLFHFST